MLNIDESLQKPICHDTEGIVVKRTLIHKNRLKREFNNYVASEHGYTSEEAYMYG